jgi:hypothetical protein
MHQRRTPRRGWTRARRAAQVALLAAGVVLASPATAATVSRRSTYHCDTTGLFRRGGAIVEASGPRAFRRGDRPMGSAAATLPQFSLADGEGVYMSSAIIGTSGRIHAVGAIHFVDATQTLVMTAAGTFEPTDAAAISVELRHHVVSLPEPTAAFTFYRSTLGGEVKFTIAVDERDEDHVCEVVGSGQARQHGEAARRQGNVPAPGRQVLASFESALPAPAL